MKAQPIYHWQFNERQGTVARDNISGVEGRFGSSSNWAKHGRIGRSVVVDGGTAHINFGNVVGQFGTSDFTVAFGMKILNNNNDNDLDIIGTRTAAGYRNVFSVQLRDKTRIVFQVCEDEAGKNFIEVLTPSLPLFTDKKWHHIALVRQ
ncbi:MAG: LamG domain-containing protein, partial [Anaerolineae bacterium]|nr:LamG domain-containing protein [Anaerolineae bacterium]